MEQDFNNHRRIAPKAYYLGILIGLIVFVGSLVKLFNCYNCTKATCNQGGMLMPVLLGITGISLILTGYYARMFALRAQDRAIRAEENLRHFAMTGKLLDKKLTLSQIIALRFASDEEFATLAKRAVDENLNSKQIKESIKNWRADHWRV